MWWAVLSIDEDNILSETKEQDLFNLIDAKSITTPYFSFTRIVEGKYLFGKSINAGIKIKHSDVFKRYVPQTSQKPSEVFLKKIFINANNIETKFTPIISYIHGTHIGNKV